MTTNPYVASFLVGAAGSVGTSAGMSTYNYVKNKTAQVASSSV